jgi:hypothetical protein
MQENQEKVVAKSSILSLNPRAGIGSMERYTHSITKLIFRPVLHAPGMPYSS